jgi:diguanylate cyclase (GGDEF)-like protein/PAS domain S-box-containing protein
MEDTTDNLQLPFPPSHDDIPMLICETDGMPVYINTAAERLVTTLDVSSIQKLLPANHTKLVDICYRKGTISRTEVKLKGYTVCWSYYPDPEQETIYLYGEQPSSEIVELEGNANDAKQKLDRTDIIATAVAMSVRENSKIADSELDQPKKVTEANQEASQAIELLQQRYAQALSELETLRYSEQTYRTLYENNPTLFFTIDIHRKILSANGFGVQQIGYKAKDLVGEPWSVLVDKTQETVIEKYLDAVFRNPKVVHRWKTNLKCKPPIHPIWVGVSARIVVLHGQPTALIVCEDITEVHYLHEQLTHQASHDALTGLTNRREFERRLQLALKTAWEDKAEHALCYVDLDQFKIINDTCGHIAGDTLLAQLSRLIQKQIRKNDLLARLGGDEFGILMEHCTIEETRRVADDIRRAIESFKFAWEGQNFSIAASIGLVPIDSTCENITGILSAADAACYEAKDAGRNRVHEYNEKDTVMVRRHGEMQLVLKIDQALQHHRFRLYYQSIVPIKVQNSPASSGEHYELLIRLKEEDGEIAQPGTFLPTAERYRLSDKLDRWVIKTAFEWFINNPKQLEQLAICAINLSGYSMADERFHEYVIDQFDKTGMTPYKVCFEITETAAIANLNSATRMISFLQELGCHFALDDFGSGLSSFGYLKNLPVDYLKIDGAFVKDMLHNTMDLEMVRSINGIAQLMGKKTIAEFVESKGILEALRDLGVDYAQGYYIGKPQPIENRLEQTPMKNIALF